MKRFTLIGFLLVAVSLFLTACGHSDAPTAEKPEQKKEGNRFVTKTNGETILTLDAETQKSIGLKVETLKPVDVRPETTCIGHILDPAPLITALNDVAVAKANVTVSQKELERLKVLRQQNNTSDRAVEAGEAAAAKDSLALQTATDKLQLSWGKTFASREDLPNISKQLVGGESSLARIELTDSILPRAPQHASIILGTNRFDAELIGAATAVDPVVQLRGIIYLVKAGPDALPVNAFVTSRLPSGAEAAKGIAIPSSAVIVHDGSAFYYEQTGETEFHRRLLQNSLGGPEDGYLVANPPESLRVVTTGAQQLLSEELKSQIQAD